ncbi:MAG: hypothetical protein J6U52_08425 [Alistipes sp.]|nr:hypothetical protein [Alistipes sp.]
MVAFVKTDKDGKAAVAVEVPAGKHTIEWRYRAPKWGLIEGITLLFSLIVLVAVVLTILIPVINAKRQKTQA